MSLLHALLLFFLLSVPFIGSSKVSAAPNPCLKTLLRLEQTSRSEIIKLTENPVESWLDFKSRFEKRKASHPQDPWNFLVPEFESTLAFIVEKLQRRLEILKLKRAEDFRRELELVKKFLEEAEDYLEDGIPYGKFIEFTYYYTRLASLYIPTSLFGDNREVIHKLDELEKIYKKRVFARSGYFASHESHPLATFFEDSNRFVMLFPTHENLDITDFNKLHTVPLFFLGVTDKRTHADGISFSPLTYFDHDLGHALNNMTIKDERFPSLRTILGTSKKMTLLLDKVDDIRSPLKKRAVEILLFEFFHEQGLSFKTFSLRTPLFDPMGILVVSNKIRAGFYGDAESFGRSTKSNVIWAHHWLLKNR